VTVTFSGGAVTVINIGGTPAAAPAAGAAATTFDLAAKIAEVTGSDVTVSLKLPVTATTAVTIGGETKAAADLKPAQSVTVTFSGGAVTKISAGGDAAAPAAAEPAPSEPPAAAETPAKTE
jgi:hypothetical protein